MQVLNSLNPINPLSGDNILSGDHELRALIATQSTLKWFIIIGIVAMIVGVVIQWLLHPLIGLIFLWGGITISALSLTSLLFLWLADRYLPQPK